MFTIVDVRVACDGSMVASLCRGAARAVDVEGGAVRRDSPGLSFRGVGACWDLDDMDRRIGSWPRTIGEMFAADSSRLSAVSWLKRAFTSSEDLANVVSIISCVTGSSSMLAPWFSHLVTVRASTPRCAAKFRTLRRIAWRSALVSAPVQNPQSPLCTPIPRLRTLQRTVVPHQFHAGATSVHFP